MDPKWKKWAIGGGLLAGLALVGGARYLIRERATPEPPFAPVEEDGPFALRDYGSMWVAQTSVAGERRPAIRAGFKTLADYIFARSHDGDEVPMTVPVMQEEGEASTWTVRFVMPEDYARADLPDPPAGVTLEQLPPRRVAVIEFDGRPEDVDFDVEEAHLTEWIAAKGFKPTGAPMVHAFYNSPAMPGPLRRNELWIEVER
ncbi:SOUL family heme-binding protein [Sphingomicrobium nitratireducens]|uniref:SOUL family heme-binding protein n=1 Tax=Sphingomicrobium nitratireducens TaxID=2964666 RepID=UPI00223F6BE0|nr:heme-binding protein [Sphingomicrobium nitratireducens]